MTPTNSVQNISDAIPENRETSEIDSNGLRELIRAGANRVALITSMSLAGLGLTQQATAQDIQLALDVPRETSRVAEAFRGIPMTTEEIAAQSERYRTIAEVSRIRQNGIAFYGPYLGQFSQLSEEGQYQVALAINPNNGQGGPDMSQEYVDLVQNLRVPEAMIDAIIEEAQNNGANVMQRRGYRRVLAQLREQGNTDAQLIGYIFEKAPRSASNLYIVVVSQALIDANRDAQGRLVDAQGRLVDAEGRLVDAQGRLVDAQNIGAALDGITEEVNSN